MTSGDPDFRCKLEKSRQENPTVAIKGLSSVDLPGMGHPSVFVVAVDADAFWCFRHKLRSPPSFVMSGKACVRSGCKHVDFVTKSQNVRFVSICSEKKQSATFALVPRTEKTHNATSGTMLLPEHREQRPTQREPAIRLAVAAETLTAPYRFAIDVRF